MAPFYKAWLYIYHGSNPGYIEEDTGTERNRREIVLSTDNTLEAQDIVRARSDKRNVQILVRQDDSCDVLSPRKRKNHGKWKHYQHLDAFLVSHELRR